MLMRFRGLDASLGFESNRAENAGLFVNDTLTFMVPVSNFNFFGTSGHILIGMNKDRLGVSQHE